MQMLIIYLQIENNIQNNKISYVDRHITLTVNLMSSFTWGFPVGHLLETTTGNLLIAASSYQYFSCALQTFNGWLDALQGYSSV